MKSINICKNINDKGITLIALVVTIIILIILAGVSINIVMDENGLINKAKEQRIIQAKAEILENLELAKGVVTIEGNGYISLEEYLTYIEQNGLNSHKVTNINRIDDKNSEITVDNKYVYTVTQIGNNLIINEKGKVEEVNPEIGSFAVTYYIDTDNSYEEKVNKDETCLSPTTFIPTKDGWIFVGWREDNTASEEVLTSKVMESESITLYAVFKQDVTVTYYNNTTIAEETTQSKYYNNGNTVNPTFTIDQSEKSEWTNCGWSTAEAGDAEVTYSSLSNTAISSDVTLYGLYYKELTLSYDGNGATSGSVATQKGNAYYNSAGNTVNPSFALAANGFDKTNYTFTGWNLGVVGATITISENTTATAQWTGSTISLTGTTSTSIHFSGAQGGQTSTVYAYLPSSAVGQTLTATVSFSWSSSIFNRVSNQKGYITCGGTTIYIYDLGDTGCNYSPKSETKTITFTPTSTQLTLYVGATKNPNPDQNTQWVSMGISINNVKVK